jgi:hypothetical protein
MWQSDIFCFRLGGTNAYLIAFMDDYSRFITGIELFRSQTAQAVIEVYRRAVAEYGTPKEMLTDNGRQYAAWRGRTRFQMELAKDRVAHIRSQPHHPMTLGKVERFWGSVWREFLGRARFDDFEAARARIRLWVQYYNHKRPHQGLGGLCPADRFFEIQHELRKTLEEGIRDNVLEMALRGRPNAPFYMVGRMHGQSVVLHAEKGKLKLRVDDDNLNTNHELEYDIQTETPPDTPDQDPTTKSKRAKSRSKPPRTRRPARVFRRAADSCRSSSRSSTSTTPGRAAASADARPPRPTSAAKRAGRKNAATKYFAGYPPVRSPYSKRNGNGPITTPPAPHGAAPWSPGSAAST